MSVLEITNVEVVYKRKYRDPVRAVAGVSLSLDKGQIIGLVGESGCGKSTLARAAAGLVTPTAGTVQLNGKAVPPLTRKARGRDETRLQMVFQDPRSSLNPRRSVGSQIADPLEILAIRPRRERKGRVQELLELVGLSPTSVDRFPHQFSGGQLQRIAIARALAAEPSALVLDEPLSALDASAQAQVANLLMDLSRQLGIAMLLISHDLAIVNQIADEVAVMYLGLIVERAQTRELWRTPLHPYTEALIGSIPLVGHGRQAPVVISGEVPDPARPPSGCRFHTRCPYAMDICATENPPLLQAGDTRSKACWLPAGEGGQTLADIERNPAEL